MNTQEQEVPAAPWDDPSTSTWDNVLVEQPEEYREYLKAFGLATDPC